MNKPFFFRLLTSCFLALLSIPTGVFAQTVGVFYDSNVAQIKFAAEDVKVVLETKGFTVEMLPLSKLNASYTNKKVVISLTTDTLVTKNLKEQGVTLPAGLGEQAYGLRTTTTPQTSYWVVGGDANGAMYGGFQIGEHIKFKEFTGVYNIQESPKILKRGIKLNLPFDAKGPTYFSSNNSTASKNAIANVWDISFWTTWFDEMARYRYNVISVWNNHPFTSMIKLPDYPDVVINNVTGYSDIYNNNDNTGVVIKTMTIDQKIEFWRNVMAYAKSRGFTFYLFNWNLFTDGAEGKYGITEGAAGVTNQATITYMRKCMYELLKTYPDLDGFGVTEGEAMINNNDEANSLFLGSTFGKGMADFAKDNPQRRLNFIHRWHMADFTLIKKNFAELFACPNVTFDMSFKYSAAHMYSSASPDFMSESNINALKSNNLKTWFTVRNDDFYYHNWGDPNYARAYINNIPGKDDWFKGFYIGSDGFHQTRTFFSKNSVTQGLLEIQRLWYMNMLWGRLAFNPNTPDDVFKNYMNLKYPGVSSNDLFAAWSKTSGALTKVGEIFFNDLNLDFEWYPENCQDKDGFLTIADFAAAKPRSASPQCGIAGTAANSCNGKVTSFKIADQIEASAASALSLISSMSSSANADLGVTLVTIKALSYLNLYYAYKIRGATYNAANNKTEAKNAMETAYCWWMKYSNLMDANYKGMSCQRSFAFATWHQHDAAVLKEYTDLGGVGTPACAAMDYQITLSVNDSAGGTVKGEGIFKSGDNVTVAATTNAGYKFGSWKENGLIVSTDSVYQFIVTMDRRLVANFISKTACDLPWSDQDFTVNSGSVQKALGPISTSCASYITISLDAEGAGNLETSDYCKIYYRVDGGSLIPFVNKTGSFAKQTFTANIVTGSYVELIFDVKNSYSDEFYHIKNISALNEITSVNSNTLGGVKIYPNPVTDVLNIDFSGVDTNRDIRIFNALGQLVYQFQTKNASNQIQIKSLNFRGIALIQVINGETVTNHKVIIR